MNLPLANSLRLAVAHFAHLPLSRVDVRIAATASGVSVEVLVDGLPATGSAAAFVDALIHAARSEAHRR